MWGLRRGRSGGPIDWAEADGSRRALGLEEGRHQSGDRGRQRRCPRSSPTAIALVLDYGQHGHSAQFTHGAT